jgi:hypothetical protein
VDRIYTSDGGALRTSASFTDENEDDDDEEEEEESARRRRVGRARLCGACVALHVYAFGESINQQQS